MWFLIIVIISLSLGIWKFPFINYHARKSFEGSVGCNKCDDCKVCTPAVIAAIFAIVSLPLMLLWVRVIKPTAIKVIIWQKERVKTYTKVKDGK